MTPIKTTQDLLTSPHPVAVKVREGQPFRPRMIIGCLDENDEPVWFDATGQGDRREVALYTLRAAINNGWRVYVAQQIAIQCAANPDTWDVWHWNGEDYELMGWQEPLPTNAAIWSVTDTPAERELMEVECYA